ncbi:BNR-4 repeat-containing protein [Reichenbachiella ulvae]|uniref:BNR-4 repeat-containing protein n=1 Tax=Reichenbachiella ulvae TaxID=2980104 RepID=A0ABT3CSH5_9BACT|nr:BNR-4 repeat-containing protein [Reichenbachiella ulvae]MCV9386665.1 BNR-4 repeat-containing protein [Reichenbachiella ulvae]
MKTKNYLLGKLKYGLLLLFILTMGVDALSQIQLESEVQIATNALFFDGNDVPSNEPDNGTAVYDFFFGNKISVHGDCIEEYDGYVFLTWYKGGKFNRQVMLSRYNPYTGVVKTIEFPHRHNGYQNRWWIGESHNTIAVGICPKDETIHLLYDMHAYSPTKPSDGSLADDYFRYSFSMKNVAKIADAEFTLDKFVKDSDGDYKHIKMRDGTDYQSLTYPHFFTNKQGDLFMWIREGGNNNGAYKFCKYDGNSWSDFTQFNILGAKNNGLSYNWGLYGDIKFESGKMRIGFCKRSSNNNDKFKYNNGFYYAYSDDPNGLSQWKNHAGTGFSLPLIDPDQIMVSEPGDEVSCTSPNSVTLSGGADWTATERGDVHMRTVVRCNGQSTWVHTYKKGGTNNFITTTDFPGGDFYAYKNDIYLIGLSGGRPFVDKAEGGTNDFTRVYEATSGKSFRHGVVHISNGKVHYYLMENQSGAAQPTHLQIIDLGLDENDAPPAGFSYAADEGDMVNVTGTIDIAYGAIGQFNYLYNQTSDVTCSNATFGDPIPGTVKKCYVKSVSYPEIESADGAQAPNVAENLLDGLTDDDHRWSAQVYPKSVVIDYGESKNIVGTQVHTYQNRSYHYTISISDNPNSGFVEVVNQSGKAASHPIEHSFASTSGRYVKLTVTGATGYSSNWVSINELNIVEGSVTPDPVTTTLSPTEDAYLQGSTRHNNTLIRIESGNRVGYLQFDLSSINGTITDAQLKLTCDSDGGSGLITVAKGNSSNWTEDNLSTSNAPSSSGQLGSINTTYNVGSTYTWALDESSISGGGELSLILTQSGGNDAAFASKESSVPSAKLEITYIPSGGARMRSDNESAASKPKGQYLQIYPNPAKDKFTITLDGNSIETLAIYTLGGLELYQTDSIEGKIELSKGTLFTRGMYLIKAIDNQGLMYQQKLIVE